MRLRKASVACALALAAVSGHALAVAPGNCDPAVGGPFDLDVYLTGASAPQTILGAIMGQILNAGFTTVYDPGVAGAAAGASYRAYCGVLNNTTGALSGKKIRFLHRAKGGSVWGVNPVARDESIATLGFANANCVAAGGAGRQFDCAEIGDDLNQANADNRKPSFGVADVEPAQFKGPLNVEFGQTQLNATEAAKFNGTQRVTNGVIFSPALTQNLIGAGVDNLTRAQVTAILTGNYVEWNQIKSTIAAGSNITVCRRVQGSGTQAVFNNYFLNFPCSTGNIAASGDLGPLRMTDSFGYGVGGTGTQADPIQIDPTAGPTYVENPSSGNVRSCLDNAFKKTDWTFRGDDGQYYTVQFSKTAGGGRLEYGAIGILSLDSYGQTSYGASWSFPKFNGNVATSVITANPATSDYTGLVNVITGAHDLVGEQSIQWKNDKAFPNANYTAFFELFVQKSGQESILRGISNTATRAGVVALPTIPGNSVTLPASPATNQTAQWTRGGNACRPASLSF